MAFSLSNAQKYFRDWWLADATLVSSIARPFQGMAHPQTSYPIAVFNVAIDEATRPANTSTTEYVETVNIDVLITSDSANLAAGTTACDRLVAAYRGTTAATLTGYSLVSNFVGPIATFKDDDGLHNWAVRIRLQFQES